MFDWSKLTPSTVVPGKEVMDYVSVGFVAFEFSAGVVAKVVQLHAELTYRGWLEGVPYSRSNELFILPGMKRPPPCMSDSRPVHVCKVARHSFLANVSQPGEPDDLREAELFPRLQFSVLLERWTQDPLRCRQLIVVWQQMDDEKVPPERVRQELRALDWESLSAELHDDEFA